MGKLSTCSCYVSLQDALSEYILGVSKSGKDKTESSDSDSAKSGSKLETSEPESIDSSLEWEPEKKVMEQNMDHFIHVLGDSVLRLSYVAPYSLQKLSFV